MREILSGHARLLVDIGKEMPPTLANGYVASQAMIDKRPTELRATIAALLDAAAYMRASSAASATVPPDGRSSPPGNSDCAVQTGPASGR